MEVEMNIWIIGAIVLGVFAIAGALITGIGSVNADDNAGITSTKTCTSCGGSCTAGSNCGLATCGAANGGKCNCGK
jgi:hypothetical protein